MRISGGKIRLENLVLDYSNFETYPKTTEKDLESHYDSFIEHTPEIQDYFENQEAFNKAVNDAAGDKRPKLVARETKYPFMWIFRTSFMPFDFLRPKTRRLNDDYFIVAHCITEIPIKKESSEEKEESLDIKLKEDLREKFKQYSNYEGILEIPNDGTPS